MNSIIIALNLVRRTIGTRKGIIIYLLVPTIILSVIVFLVGQSGDSTDEIGYLDRDQSIYSQHIVHELEQLHDYQLVMASSEDELKRMVMEKSVDTAFMIPPGWGDRLATDEPLNLIQVRLSLNETTFTLERMLDNETIMLIDSLAGLAAATTIQAQPEQVAALLEQQQKHQIATAVNEWQPNVNDSFSTIIGFMLMFMMIVINQSVTQVVEDRHKQTMSRMYAAPVFAVHIAAGNFLGSLVLGTLQVASILFFTTVVFGFDFGVPIWSLFIVLECFIFAALGIASAVAGLVRNTDQLSTINTLIMTPTCMLGGCFWPVQFMPDFMQKIANFVPQKWAIEAMTRMAGGEALSAVLMQLGILLLFAAVLLGFGSAVLKPNEAATN